MTSKTKKIFLLLISIIGLVIFLSLEDFIAIKSVKFDYPLSTSESSSSSKEAHHAPLTSKLELNGHIKADISEDDTSIKKRELITDILHQNYKLLNCLTEMEILVRDNKAISSLIPLLSMNDQHNNTQLIKKIVELAYEYSETHLAYRRVIFPEDNRFLAWLKYFLIVEKNGFENIKEYQERVDNLLKAINSLKDQISSKVLIRGLINEL